MKRFLPALLLTVGCATVPHAAPPPPEPVRVTLVGTTDLHGWFNGRVETPRGGGQPLAYGGLPLFASYVNALRAENGGRVVVVDSGDMYQGTLESNLFEGEPVVRAYNAIGYAGAALGNHEFDFGPVGPSSVPRTPGDDPLGAVKKNVALATFPFLSANVIDRNTGTTPSWARRSVIVDAGGAKIGVIGLSLEDTANVTMAANVRTLEFTDPLAALIREAAALRSAGADAIVVTAHIGGRCRDMQDVMDVASCEPDQQAVRLIRSIPAGTVDVYFGGHTHSQVRQIINGVVVLQALPFSQEFATVDILVDTEANRVLADRTTIRPHTMICRVVYSGTERCDPRNAPAGATLVPRIVGGRAVEPDAKLTALVTPYLEQVTEKRNEKVGITTTAPFTRNYQRESALGNFIADAMREWAEADIAFINSGGIRANLREGELVYGDFFEMSPFDNYPAVLMMTGEQITAGLRATTGGERGVLQTSGLRYVIDEALDADKPAAERNRLVSVTLPDGRPLEPQKLYKVVMPDFLVAGGEGMGAALATIPPDRIQIDQNITLRDLVVEVLRKRGSGPYSPKIEERIKILNPRQNPRPE